MGIYSTELVGESRYQAAVGKLRVDEPVELVPEPDNPHDPRAVRAVSTSGETLGYVPRDSWLIRCVYDGTRVTTRVKTIVGGEPGKPSRGVVLEVRTAAHAEASEPSRPQSGRALPLWRKLLGGVMFAALLIVIVETCSAAAP